MKCKKAERRILRSFDKKLEPGESRALEDHLRSCPACRRIKEEYLRIRNILGAPESAHPHPQLTERIARALGNQSEVNPWEIRKKWGLRAAPVSVAVVLIIVVAGLFLFSPPASPPASDSLSQTEKLLLKNLNFFEDSPIILDSENAEAQNIMLIFTSLEDKEGIRRYIP